MKNQLKKSLAVGLLAAGLTPAVFAQGTIDFATFNGQNSAKGQVFQPNSTTPIGATFVGQLWDEAVGGTTLTALSAVETFNSSGVINFGTLNDPNNAPGDQIDYVLRVWNSAAGTDWNTAVGNNPLGGTGSPQLTAFGQSALTKVTLGGIDSDGNPNTVPFSNGYANFALTPTVTPEPATIALGGLGAAALLALRRRK
jgi:hypothetical protein